MLLSSARLVLLPLEEADFEALHALLIEPGVRRYLCDDVIIPETQTREYLQRSRELRDAVGAGLWNVASIRVLDRLGFVMTDRRTAKGLDTSFYSLSQRT